MHDAIEIESRVGHATLDARRVRPNFKDGPLWRVRFPAGFQLYKVTQDGSLDASGGVRPKASGRITEWWFSYESVRAAHPEHGTLDLRGAEDVIRHASKTSGDLVSFLRARGAVCHDWNRMTHLLRVELRRPSVGLVGACSGKPFYEDDALRRAHRVENVSFIGGEQQIYLPGLGATDVSVVRYGPLAR